MPLPRSRFGLVLLGPLFLAGGLPLAGQDIELLGEYYGTRPPDAYYELIQRDPSAFRFSQEGPARLERLRTSSNLRQFGPGAPGGVIGLAIGPRDDPVVGEFRFPLILGLFSDGPQIGPFPPAQIQQEFFDGPNSRVQTIPQLYSEMSRGLLQFKGTTFPWVQTGLTRQAVTQNANGLSPSLTPGVGVGSFIEAILEELDDGSIDWSQFDMDGDGYVDFITVMHPYRGGECLGADGLHIWSHRWSLTGATSNRLGQGFVTRTPYEGGGFIRINDYTIQAVLDCTSPEPSSPGLLINRIGVFAHELGHALGLPDLYSTGAANGQISGSGIWDLMGTGAWGCGRVNDAERPCHMGAWSKAALGWVDVEEIGPGEDRVETLAPVEMAGRVLKIPASDGSREYLLLENRQRIGSDVHLLEPGLLVWHIDPEMVDPRWPQNAVNAVPSRFGVWLRQADGKNHLALASGGRGDEGDPFPGCIRDDHLNPSLPCVRNPEFHIGTVPRAVTHEGRAMGIALSEIELLGAEPHDVRFRVDTQFGWDTLYVDAEVEAVKDENLSFEIAGAPAESLTWRLVGGSLPAGLTFQPSTGRLQGLTFETGSFDFVLGAASSPNQETHVVVALEVVPPVIARDELVAEFLGLPNTLSLPLRIYLDAQGNQNGGFADLGDIRAYLQANPGAPESAGVSASPSRIIVSPWSSRRRLDP
ncbi:MAG: M6 family metalloprotease domain-containing protein [Gemmatimonadota bacterium]